MRSIRWELIRLTHELMEDLERDGRPGDVRVTVRCGSPVLSRNSRDVKLQESTLELTARRPGRSRRSRPKLDRKVRLLGVRASSECSSLQKQASHLRTCRVGL